MYIYLLTVTGIIIILALAIYALYLWKKVWKQDQKTSEQQDAQLKTELENTQKARKNIIIMARVVLENQVPLTEAAIRIMAYTRALPMSEQSSSHYNAFDQLAKATAHIPILDQWKNLTPEKQDQLTAERLDLENKHHKQIIKACQQLTQTPTNNQDSVGIYQPH